MFKQYCVVDYQNNYKTLVMCDQKKEDEQRKVLFYDLLPGERLIDAPCPVTSFCRPRWTGESWEETATPEELATWESEWNPPLL